MGDIKNMCKAVWENDFGVLWRMRRRGQGQTTWAFLFPASLFAPLCLQIHLAKGKR